MVAIVGGSGLGLLNSSAGVLGGQGVFGNAVLGGNKESAYLNIVNGNLMLQDSDDYLASRGVNVALTRTYNSQGSYNDGNGAAWKYGLARSVSGLTGAVNTAGSTVTRTAGDGSVALYTYDTAKAAYVTTDGGGAYQSMVFDAATNQWTWRGDRFDLLGVYERYDGANGRLISVHDQVGMRQKFFYNADGRLSQITDAAGTIGLAGDMPNSLNDLITFEYDANGNLAAINTRLAGADTGNGSASINNLIRVHYTYDALNRLASTIIDLSVVHYDSSGKPLLTEDNLSIADGNTYTTIYSYDGDSNRIAKVSQSDGTSTSFTYQEINGAWKVSSYADGLNRTTRLDYSVPGKTTVTDPLGLKTVYGFDAKGQLTDITAPAVGTAAPQTMKYVYDAKGNLSQVTDARGLVTSYGYDANGNRILERDAVGNTIARSYNLTSNLLLGEARYVTPDPDGAGASAASTPLSTRYIYSTDNRLHYVFSPEGRVTEYRYNALGEIATEIHYESTLFGTAGWPVLAAGQTEAYVTNALAGATFDKTRIARTDYAYDARGLRVSATRYASTDTNGAGVLDGKQSVTRYVYDQAGQLLVSYDGNNNPTTYVYDGMGRLISSTDAAGNSMTALYDDQRGLRIVRTIAAGNSLAIQTIYARDAAGQLISVRSEAIGAPTGTVTNTYDADGRLRVSTDGAGQKTYWLYDDAGRKIAQIEHNGALTEFIYNAANQVTRTIQYASTVATSGLLDALGKPANISLNDLRPTDNPQLNRSTYNNYDQAGRLNATIDANGYLTRMVYDGASRLVQTIYRALPIDDLSKLDGQTIAASYTGEASPADRISRNFYTDDGMLAGKLDPLGYLTEYVYNQAGLLVDTISYANITAASLRAAGALASLRPAAHASDIHQRNLYDGQHRLVATIDGDNFITTLSYDAAGNVSSRRRYATAVSTPTALTLDKVGLTSSTDDRITSYSYTALNQLALQTDPAGTYTAYTYDVNGKVLTIKRGTGGVAELSSTARYDGNGRLIAELSAEGASRLAALPAPQDAAAVNGIWALYASHYSYDASGLRVSATDGQGKRTLYFYDSIGRLSHTINDAGEVTEQRYNTFGQVVKTIRYGQRIDALKLRALTGGRDDATFAALTLAGSGDVATTAYYDNGGRLRYTVDGAGQVQARLYNAFNQVVESISYAGRIDAVALSKLTGEANTDKLASYSGVNNQRNLFYYDADGQLIYTINALGEVQGKTYNAVGQVLSTTQYGLRAASPQTLKGDASEIAGFALANAANSVLSYSYNRRGGVVDQTLDGNHTLYTYNGFGEAIKAARLATANSVTAAPLLDQVSQTVYDLNGRVAASIDPTGTVTVYQYDSAGHVVDQVRYANALAGFATSTNIAKTYNDAVAAKLLSDPARDQHQRFIYDTDGNLAVTLTAQSTSVDAQGKVSIAWSVVRQTRDLDGRVVARTAYAQRMEGNTLTPDSATVNAWMAAADVRNLNDPLGADALLRYVYDGAGRLLATATAQGRDGSNNVQWSVTRQWYDTRGNVTQRTTYGAWLAGNAPSDTDILSMAASASDAVTAYEYDGANRVVTTAVARGPGGQPVSQQWALSSVVYDSFGNITSKTQYATILLRNELPAKFGALAVASAGVDRVTAYRYDSLNRPVVSIDAAGAITRQVYDTRGNVVQTIAYAATTTAPETIGATYNPALTASDRVTRTVYDLQHRPVYQIDPLGQVTERSYDTLGNLVSVIRYATPLNAAKLAALSAAGTDALPAAAKTAMALAAPVLTLDRVERYAYDQDGQLRYTVDAAGYLKETIYNALGQVTETRDYLQLPTTALPLAPTAAQLLAEATRQYNAGYAAVNTHTYDAQGNLLSSTDALNATERYQYDGLRNKISFTNKANNTWTYRYDAAGHLLQETSPQVDAYVNGIGVAMGAWGAGTPTALVTLLEYDALGNLRKRTEAANTASAREIRYTYDAVGRQTQTILQSASIYSDANDTKNSIGGAGRIEVDSGDRITSVTYNAFGDAVANRDVGGQLSYKVYDQRGQVAYDVDALGYVTAYERDSFGNVIRLTRYATQPKANDQGYSPAVLNAAQFAAQIRLDGANDRTIRTAYDLLGRVIKVSEPLVLAYDQRATGASPYVYASKTTDTAYNTFGETIATSVYGANSNDSTSSNYQRVTAGSESRYFYDNRGNKTGEINALSVLAGGHTGTGYLTTYTYGFDTASKTSTVRKTEYASSYSWNDALPNGGALPTAVAALDRVTESAYDKNKQLLASTNIKVSVYEEGKLITRDVRTSYTYDAVGNQTSVTDGLGGTVFTYFDKLGRTIGVAKAQTVAYIDTPNGGSPVTEFKLDILGNVILRIDYAGNPPSLPTLAGVTPPDITEKANRVTASRYDRDGHAIQVQDAEQFANNDLSSLINTSYDVYGRVAKQWRSVVSYYSTGATQIQTAFQINRYDALGRVQEVLTPGQVNLVDNIAAGVTHKSNLFNQFGELVGTRIGRSASGEAPASLTQVSYTRYDQAGRAWLSNASDGVDRATLYDALGQVTAQVASTSTEQHALQSLTGAEQVQAQKQVLRTETRYDMLGHVVDNRLIDDPRLTVLTRANGAWVRTQLDQGSALGGSLVQVGDILDRSNTVTVKYRLQGTAAWTEGAATRLQWLDNNLAFSTVGLADGNYEFVVTVTPPGEPAFERTTGNWTVATEASPRNANLLGQAYLALLRRGADLIGLNFYVTRLNQGESLARLVSDFINSTEAAGFQYTSRDSKLVIEDLLRNMGRGGAGDDTFAGDVALWAQRYDAARKQGGEAPAQVLLDVIDSVASYTGQNGVQQAARIRLANQLSATLEYAQSYMGTVAGTARDIAALAATNLEAARAMARDKGSEELRSGQITQLYLALFGRAPEKDGLRSWLNAMQQGLSIAQVADGMLASAEAKDPLLYPDQTTTSAYQLQLVRTVYQTMLGRAATAAEESDALGQLNGKPGVAAISNGQWLVQLTGQVAGYTGADAAKLAEKAAFNNRVTIGLSFAEQNLSDVPLASRGAVSKALMASIGSAATAQAAADAAVAANATTITVNNTLATLAGTANGATLLDNMRLQLSRMYVVLLNRTLDTTGLNYQLSQLTSETSGAPSSARWASLAEALMSSAESRDDPTLFGGVLSDQQFVERLYANALGKVPSSAAARSEIAAYVAQLATMSRGQVAVNVMNGLLHFSDVGAEEASLMRVYDNKVAVSLACAIDLGAYGWAGNGAIQTGREVLSKVSATDTKVALDYAYLKSQQSFQAANAALAASSANAVAALNAAKAAATAAAQAATAVQTATTAANAVAGANNRLQLLALYVGVMGRDEVYYRNNPDLAGLDFQVELLATNSMDAVAQGFINSPEGNTLYPASLSNADFVARVYSRVLGGSTLGQDFYAGWTAKLSAPSSLTRGQVALGIINEVLNYANYTPSQTAVAYLQARQNMMTRLSAVAGLVDTAQAAALAAATAALAGKTQPTGTVDSLKAAVESNAKLQATALAAITTAMATANAAGDGSAENRLQITRLYATLLQYKTAPTLAEMNSRLASGLSLEAIAQQMINGNSALFPSDNNQFVVTLYKNILGRDMDAGDDITLWTRMLVNNPGDPNVRGRVALGILNAYLQYSDSSTVQITARVAFDTKISGFMATQKTAVDKASTDAAAALTAAKSATISANTALTNANKDITTAQTAAQNATLLLNAGYGQSFLSLTAYQNQVVTLYTALRGTGDVPGMAVQMRALAAGGITANNIINDLMVADKYPADNTAFVQKLYTMVLGRTGSAEDVAWWVGFITRGERTRVNVAALIIDSAEARARLPGEVAKRMPDFIATAQGYLDKRAAADAAIVLAQQKAVQATANLQQAQLNEAVADAAAKAAVKAAQAAAALTTAYAKVTAATTAALNAAKARDNYELSIKFAALNKAKAYAAADHAAAVLASANATLAAAQSTVASRYLSDSTAAVNERKATAVARVYQALLNKAPLVTELNYWAAKLSANVTQAEMADMATAILATTEGQTAFPSTLTNDAFVTKMYLFGLNRGFASDPKGLRYWSDQLAGAAPLSRAQLVAKWVSEVSLAGTTDAATFAGRVATSLQVTVTEAQSAPNLLPAILLSDSDARKAASLYNTTGAAALAASQQAQNVKALTRLYVAIFNRAPDAAGLNAWLDSMAKGNTLVQIANGMATSAEGLRLYPASMTTRDFIKQMLNNVLGRAPLDAEIVVYMNATANKTRGDGVLAAINAIADGAASDLQQMTTRLSFNSRVAAALERVGAEASNNAAIAQTIRPLLLKIQAGSLIDRHADGVVLGLDTKVKSGAQQILGDNRLSVDRWGNVLSVTDARNANWKINYTYNYNNQQIDQTLNALKGDTKAAHAVTGYDALGRKVLSTDYNGNTARYGYDSNGNLRLEVHADGGKVIYDYTLFGERSAVVTQRGFGQADLRTDFAYDHLGHMVQSASNSKVVSYISQSRGERDIPIQVYSGWLIQSYTYDALGRLHTSKDAAGATTITEYDLDGNLIFTQNDSGFKKYAAFDAFHHQIATRDANSKTMYWTVDSFGQISSYTNLGNAVTNYSYDAAGRRIRQYAQAGDGQNIHYRYENAQLVEVRDDGIGMSTYYSYDRNGNRLSERQVYDNAASAPAQLQNNTLRYDMQNRLISIQDDTYLLNYAYDNNGNRIQVHTEYNNAAGVRQIQDSYNSYDSMNRQLVVNGDKVNNAVVYGKRGHLLSYDYAGNRLTDTFIGKAIASDGMSYRTVDNSVTVESYSYDEVGRLSTTSRDGVVINTRRYDQAGRLTVSGILTATSMNNLDAVVDGVGGSSNTRIYAYNALGQLMEQRDERYDRSGQAGRGALIQNTWFGHEGYDAVGNLMHYALSPANTAPSKNYYYKITYDHADGYKEETVTVGSKTNTSYYDVNGNRISVYEQGGKLVNQYWYDADGHIQSRKDDAGQHFWLIVNGQVLGEETRTEDNVLGSIYTGVSSSALTAPPATYSVQSASETLQSIAQNLWGDAKLWYLIADANASVVGPDGKLTPGEILRIPTRVNTVHNDYATYRPYDAAEALGDTTPTPPPPSGGKGGCGAIGQLIMVVVAVAVTVITAGTLGPVVAAALGSVSSQLVGIAIGAQEGFSWKGVALAAVTAGVTQGIGELASNGVLGETLKQTSWQGTAARAALSNTVSQGIGNLTGLQHGFSWTSVAASATGAAVGSQVGGYLDKSSAFDSLIGKGAAQIARATVTGFAAGTATAIARGGKIAVAQIATDAFGNALGSSLADSMRPTASSTSSGNGAGSNSGQGNVEDFDTFRARQAVSRAFAKQDAAYLAMADGPDYAGMLLSSAGAGGSGTSSGFGAVSNYAGGSLDTGWGAFSTQFTFKDQYGARVDYLGVIGNSVGKRMTADQARAYDLDQYYSAMRNGDLPTVQSNSPGIARNIGAIEGFFTFNSVGKFLKGYGEGAYNLVSAPFVGTANLVKDGYGFAKQRIFGPEVGVMGDTRPYDPQSSLVRSFMTKGGAATAGDLLHGAVMSTPIGTLNALYHGNPEEIGASLPSTALALAGGAVSRTSINSLDAMEGSARLGGQLYGQEKLATLGAYLERRGIALRVGDEHLPPGYAGGFSAGERALVLRDNPTNYEVWHELTHYQQYKALGETAYSAQTRLMKEQYVFDKLESMPKRWNSLQPEEMSHARWYIDKVGGLW